MEDIIIGKVSRIIDGRTFEMKLSRVSEKNKYQYSYLEIIRISGLDIPEKGTSEGRSATTILETKLRGKTVRCSVKSRDKYGRRVAEIEIIE